jgi:hypothetical protein
MWAFSAQAAVAPIAMVARTVATTIIPLRMFPSPREGGAPSPKTSMPIGAFLAHTPKGVEAREGSVNTTTEGRYQVARPATPSRRPKTSIRRWLCQRKPAGTSGVPEVAQRSEQSEPHHVVRVGHRKKLRQVGKVGSVELEACSTTNPKGPGGASGALVRP